MAQNLTCPHTRRYAALRPMSNGKFHKGEWCPDCRRFVPDAAGRLWHPQGLADDTLPVIGPKDYERPHSPDLFNG